MSALATVTDVSILTGKQYDPQEQVRLSALLDVISDALRVEAEKVGKDIDEMVTDSPKYANTVKMVVVDIVARVMRQSQEGEPMTQESQTALGYTWSGTYAIPGGGISGAIMRNDLKRLGFRRQRYGVMEIWESDRTESQ